MPAATFPAFSQEALRRCSGPSPTVDTMEQGDHDESSLILPSETHRAADAARTRRAIMLRMMLMLLGLMTIGLIGTPGASAQEALDCADYASQAEAQAAYRADPSDPAGNDGDGDGLACELFDFVDPATDLDPVTLATDTTTTEIDTDSDSATAVAVDTTTIAATAMPSTGSGASTASPERGLSNLALLLGLVGAGTTMGAISLRRLRRG